MRECAVRLHGQPSVGLHLVVVGGIQRIIGNQSALVLAGDKPLSEGGIQVLAVGVALMVAESICCVHVSCSAQMAASVDMLECFCTLHGGSVCDVHHGCRTCSRLAVADLTEVVLHLHIVACRSVAGELQLSAMVVDEQVVLLHIGHEHAVPGGKTVVHAQSVDRITAHRTRQSGYGYVQPVGLPPLSGGGCLDDSVVVECLQIVYQVAAVIPLAKVLRRHAVAAVHSGVTDFQSREQ